MKIKIRVGLYVMFCCLVFSVNAQKSDFKFQNITFHSIDANETEPHLSLNINKDRKMELVRVIYKSNGSVDSLNSGSFMGELNKDKFDKLLKLLRKCNFDSNISNDSVCADNTINTIIVTHNNKYFRLKSGCLPPGINDVSEYIIRLSRTVVLPRYDNAIDFEE